MNKDEILEMSRQENKKHDEMEKDVFAKGGQMAFTVGGLVCMAVILVETLLAKEVNMSTWAVYLSMSGTMLLSKYKRLHKKHELYFGLAQLALAVIFFVMYVMKLAG